MRSAKIISISLMLVLFGAVALGQSGRKQKKGPDLPPVQGVPAPSKTPDPPASDLPESNPQDEEKQEKERAARKGIILGTDWADMNVSMGVADYVRRACQAELQRVIRGIEVRANGNMSRSDAVKIAKDEDRFYTVQMEFSAMAQLEVRFMIYEPKTGKMIGAGSAWIPTDAYGRASYYGYERAGRDVARQLINRLDLSPTKLP